MFSRFPLSLTLAGALSLAAAAASSAPVSLVYNGATTPDKKTVTITQAPVTLPNGTSSQTVYAFGFNMTDTSTPSVLGSFVAWCLDVASSLSTSSTAAKPYETRSAIFSNSYSLAGATARLQSMFDANYATLTLTDGNQVAGFQLALWDAVYDGDGSLATGDFRATASADITGLANGYMAAAAAWNGGRRFDMTFLQSTETGAHKRQNLVTVAPVPVPAAGGLLLLALGGLAALRRRRAAV